MDLLRLSFLFGASHHNAASSRSHTILLSRSHGMITTRFSACVRSLATLGFVIFGSGVFSTSFNGACSLCLLYVLAFFFTILFLFSFFGFGFFFFFFFVWLKLIQYFEEVAQRDNSVSSIKTDPGFGRCLTVSLQ